MDSAKQTLSNTWHGLEKKDSWNLTWLWRKSWNSDGLDVSSSNRGPQCLIMMDSWRSSAQNHQIQLKSNFTMNVASCSSNKKQCYSKEIGLQTSSKLLVDDENTKPTRGFLKILAEIPIKQKCKKEKMKVFWCLQLLARVLNGQKIDLNITV